MLVRSPLLFILGIIFTANYLSEKIFCTRDCVYSGEIEQHKRADINDAVGIAEEPIKLANVVNKTLKRDWDIVESQTEKTGQICILLEFTSG